MKSMSNIVRLHTYYKKAETANVEPIAKYVVLFGHQKFFINTRTLKCFPIIYEVRMYQ